MSWSWVIFRFGVHGDVFNHIHFALDPTIIRREGISRQIATNAIAKQGRGRPTINASTKARVVVVLA